MQHLTDRLKVGRIERDKFRFCGREYVQHPPQNRSTVLQAPVMRDILPIQRPLDERCEREVFLIW